ncbi:hypothetical protein AAAC51_09390 [Priestia megaterium]
MIAISLCIIVANEEEVKPKHLLLRFFFLNVASAPAPCHLLRKKW